MRLFLLGFVLPIGSFWAWFLLAANDVGYVFFSRHMYDTVFQTYGDMLGIDPSLIPPMLVRACIVDTFIVLGIWAFRRRRDIAAWWSSRQTARQDIISARLPNVSSAAGPLPPAE